VNCSIYLDHNATSPPTASHLKTLFELLKNPLGNPSSPHLLGREASVALSKARATLAQALQVPLFEIIFVSGASEANNLATAGVLLASDLPVSQQHAIVSPLEHPSVRAPLDFLRTHHNLSLSTLPLSPTGILNFEDLLTHLTPNTTLVAIMAANNEIGTLQPVQKWGDFFHYLRWNQLQNPEDQSCFDDWKQKLQQHQNFSTQYFRKLHFHVDAVQSFGKIKTERWLSPGLDSFSVSGHKLGALPGIGVLVLRRGRIFSPTIRGGAQEKNKRAGTENLPGILSFHLVAQQLLQQHWWDNTAHMDALRKDFFQKLQTLPHLVLHSPFEQALPNTLSFSLEHPVFTAEDLLVELDLKGICASSGSACSSGSKLPSQVLLALLEHSGRSFEQIKHLAANSVRFSLSHSNTAQELHRVFECLQEFL
jgi:cysteine desulfurase